MKQYRDIAVELRHKTEGDQATIEGYAAVFNSYSQNLGGFVEEVLPGAFTESINTKASSKKADIRGTYNHVMTIGRQYNGTAKFAEDSTGLHFENQLNLRISEHRDLFEKIDDGLVNGASFGFEMVDWEWSHTQDGFPLLRQAAVNLFDGGPVDFPAYLETDVDRRMLYRDYAAAVAECEDEACFVERAVAELATTRKFDLSSLIPEEPEPVAPTPLLDAAREQLSTLQVR
jgi:HK97 family phage prohead protease